MSEELHFLGREWTTKEINNALEDYSNQSRQITFLVRDRDFLTQQKRRLRAEISRLTDKIENENSIERVNWIDKTLKIYDRMTKHIYDLEQQNKRYRDAREIIGQLYKDSYVRNAYGYGDGYLDGLDAAMNFIDESLESELDE